MSSEIHTEESEITTGPEKPTVDLLDWLIFPFFLLGFLAILLATDVLMRLGTLISKRAFLRAGDLLCSALCLLLKLVGTKIFVEREEELSLDRPYIIVSNHQSLFDVPLLHHLFARHAPRFVSKRELARWIPAVSFNLRRRQSALIDRSNARQALGEIGEVAKLIEREKAAIIIFPEGTRARDGRLKNFRYSGFARLLEEAPSAEIVPVTIDGSWKLVFYRRGPVPRGIEVRVKIGAALKREQLAPKALFDSAEKLISSQLDELRKIDR